MPGKNCTCCKCKDCKTVLAIEKGGGYWSPAPSVGCNGQQSIRASFIYEDSYDCNTGTNCHRQQGCAVVKVCFKKSMSVRFRIWSQLETSGSGKHKAKIQYRRLGCGSSCKSWKTVVSNASSGGGDPCCRDCDCDDVVGIFKRGKYEFRFTADSVDGTDHCLNYHVYDVKWCLKCKGKECIPTLPANPEVDRNCCTAAENDCLSAPISEPSCACPPGYTNVIAQGWNLASGGDISFV